MKITRITKNIAFILSILLIMSCVPFGAQAYSEKIDFAQTEITATPTYSAPNDVYATPTINDATFYTVTEQTPFAIADDVSYTDDISEVATILRNGMKARQNSITVHYHTTSASFGGTEAEITNLTVQFFDNAFAHTGVPTEGDSLRFGLQGVVISPSGTIIGSNYYLDITYDVTYYTTAQQEAALTQAVNALIPELNLDGNISDYKKICNIYTYMTENIRYDYANLSNPNYPLKYTAYAALINKTAVCQGYAILFYRLALEAGIDTRIIAGIGFNGIDTERHAWNIVKLDNKYYLLDATWDAGTYDYSYFLKSQADFINHYPDPEYETNAFVSSYPIAASSYVHPGSGTYTEGNFEYTISYGTATITKYTGSAKNVVVPSTIGGYPVIRLAPYAFYDNSTVQVITISEGIRYFAGNEVICRCSSLHTLNLPSTLKLDTYDGNGPNTGLSPVPINCYKLKTITVPASNPNITVYQGALYNKSMTTLLLLPPARPVEKFMIPNGVQYIGSLSCCNNLYLKEVVMPDTVVNIGYWAFDGCSNLAKINISKNCEVIGQFALSRTALTSIHIPAATTVIFAGFGEHCYLETITVDENNLVFYAEDNVLYYKCDDTWALVKHPPTSTKTSFVIPNGVTTIGWDAFDGVTNLNQLILPDTLTYIGEGAFGNCTNWGRLIFLGDAPEIAPSGYVYAKYYYPTGNTTWQKYVEKPGGIPWISGLPTEWIKSGNSWYYLNGDNGLAEGWQKIDGKWYYFDSYGVMQTSWQKIDGKWYHFTPSGVMQTGWQQIGGKWYYLGSNGAMTRGWQKINSKWYYLGTNGAMTTGWQKIDGKWYYLDTNGVMTRGWQKIDGKWYYLGTNGAMATGWQKIDGKWYYLKNEMKTGWQKINGNWYYLNLSGVMQTGWITIKETTYYLNSSGAMVTGTQVINGTTYTFNSNGALVA